MSRATHRFTGAFVDPSLEAEFQAEHFELSVKRFTRFSIGLSSVVFLGYGLHDAYLLSTVAHHAWAIRYEMCIRDSR